MATVSDMCSKCGIQGFKTNHSLQVIAATTHRVHDASGLDEQERTGHCSIEGIRSYKRTKAEAISDILSNPSKKYCGEGSSNPELPVRLVNTTISN